MKSEGFGPLLSWVMPAYSIERPVFQLRYGTDANTGLREALPGARKIAVLVPGLPDRGCDAVRGPGRGHLRACAHGQAGIQPAQGGREDLDLFHRPQPAARRR